MKPFFHCVLTTLLLAMPPALWAAEATEEQTEGVYIILDGSGSMWGKLKNGVHKITAAREVLKDYVNADFSGKSLALRIYGHNRKSDCSDTELVVPFSSPEKVASRISKIADGINPKGKTPISRSLRAALQDFGGRSGSIILISDGIETCDEDPCALVKEWRKKEININVHVVGLGLQGKEKAAMECIARASGTDYQDAQSAEELTAGMKKIHQQSIRPEFSLRGFDATGKEMAVEGFLTQAGNDDIPVKSHARFEIEPGPYTLTAGIRTLNGNLYKAATREISVKDKGSTVIDVNVATPPRVKVRHVENGKDYSGQSGSIRVFQSGKELFSFRSIDTVFIDEGGYDFRSRPNDENDLSLTAAIHVGDNLLTFELQKTVRAQIQFVSAQTKKPFLAALELSQDGQLKYKMRNPIRMLPGSYDVKIQDKLAPWEQKGVVITDQPEQKIILEVPAGLATFVYQKPDGSRDKDDRVFVNGQYVDGGSAKALLPGKYYVDGWRHKNRDYQYERVEFEIQAGDDKEIILRAK